MAGGLDCNTVMSVVWCISKDDIKQVLGKVLNRLKHAGRGGGGGGKEAQQDGGVEGGGGDQQGRLQAHQHHPHPRAR